MALRRLREKEAANYKELHCGKPIAFGKRENGNIKTSTNIRITYIL
jgi:hypothetical protein